MIKLIDRGSSHEGTPLTTQFEPGDTIDISNDRLRGHITIKVIRDANTECARHLFLGEEHRICLSAIGTRITAQQAWLVMKLFLEASWILTDVTVDTEECILAEVRRIATCQEEVDSRLPCCDAGGDGYGRD